MHGTPVWVVNLVSEQNGLSNVDIITVQADVTLYIRKELTKQVNAFTWRPLENGEYELKLFRGDQARSVHLSKSMLQKYGNKKWDKRIHMKIAETLKS